MTFLCFVRKKEKRERERGKEAKRERGKEAKWESGKGKGTETEQKGEGR